MNHGKLTAYRKTVSRFSLYFIGNCALGNMRKRNKSTTKGGMKLWQFSEWSATKAIPL